MEKKDQIITTGEEAPENSELLENGAEQSVNQKTDLAAIVKRFYPDADVSTPESLLEALTPLVENIVSFHDDLNEVVEEFPEFGDFIIALRKGYTPAQAIAMFFDPESLTPSEEDEDMTKAKDFRRKAVDERKARIATIDKNIEGSLTNIKALAEQEGWDETQTNTFADNVAALFNDWADGNLTMESLMKLKKGFAYDTDVETAFEDGQVAGKNEKISKKRASKETGDGLARLSTTGGNGQKPSPTVSVMDDTMPSRRLNFKTKN